MLRAASFEDTNAIAHVLYESRNFFMPYAPLRHTREEVQSWVGQHLIPAGGVTVAVERERIVAVLATSEDDIATWIDQLYVLPGFNNCGIGTSLMSRAHEAAKRPVRLFTFQQNLGARRFYERFGYKVIALSDGHTNEEKCPDVLYEFSSRTEA